jgi:dTDP-4-dehydrorhamnose reductase
MSLLFSSDCFGILAGKTIALVGSTGMFGQALAAEARHRKMEVYGLARHDADFCVDISSSDFLCASLSEIKPDIVINAAAITNLAYCEANPGDAYLVNAAPVANVADYCQRESVKLVQISTDHYYRGHDRKLHSEDHPVKLINQYAKTKFAGEAFARTAMESLIIRTNIVGFRSWPSNPTFVEWVIESLLKKRKMTLFSDFFTSSIDTGNCAKCVFDLISRDCSGVINVGASECFSKADFIFALAEKLGLSTRNCHLGSVEQMDSRFIRANSLGLDVTLAQSILQEKMPSLSEVINSIIEHYEKIHDLR